jgi:hypothetical protein
MSIAASRSTKLQRFQSVAMSRMTPCPEEIVEIAYALSCAGAVSWVTTGPRNLAAIPGVGLAATQVIGEQSDERRVILEGFTKG